LLSRHSSTSAAWRMSSDVGLSCRRTLDLGKRQENGAVWLNPCK
jgi:hypothetical protein